MDDCPLHYIRLYAHEKGDGLASVNDAGQGWKGVEKNLKFIGRRKKSHELSCAGQRGDQLRAEVPEETGVRGYGGNDQAV